MRRLKDIFKKEEGQVLVLFALLFVVIMGFAALTIDVGMVAVQKTKMQNAADAAALAGAQSLPSTGIAETLAVQFAGLNGIKATENGIKSDGDTIIVTTHYNSNPNLIEVICTRTVSFSFARVLGFEETDVSARAVAERKKSWAGEGLPFINFNEEFLAMGTQVEAWEKVNSGYFESIENFDVMNNETPYDNIYFQLHIEDGLQIKNGKVATKKQEIGYYYNTHKSSIVPTPYVYMFSLSPKAFATGKVTLQSGVEKEISKLKNKNDFVSLKSLVLIKCTFDTYDKKILDLTSVAAYDLGNNDEGYPDLPDYPLDYDGPNSKGAKLVE